MLDKKPNLWYNKNVKKIRVTTKRQKGIDTMKKMSYVSAVDAVLSGAEITAEVRERLEALKASLEKRASHKSEGPTKAQKERMALAEKVFAQMEEGVEYGNADITALIPELEGATPQKVSPLMKLLGERIVTSKVKGKAIYKIA